MRLRLKWGVAQYESGCKIFLMMRLNFGGFEVKD